VLWGRGGDARACLSCAGGPVVCRNGGRAVCASEDGVPVVCGSAGGVRACRQCVGVPAGCGRAGGVQARRPCGGVPAVCGRAGGVCARQRCVGVPVVCGRSGHVRAFRPCAGVPAVWAGSQTRRVWPRMRAVRQCLRIEPASVWSDGCAWRHVDRRRSKSICHDVRAVKRRNCAVEPSSWSTESITRLRLRQDDLLFSSFNGGLHTL